VSFSGCSPTASLANGLLGEVIHKLYPRIPHFRNAIQFGGTLVNAISSMCIRKVQPPLYQFLHKSRIFNSIMQWHTMILLEGEAEMLYSITQVCMMERETKLKWVSYTKLHPNRTINVEGTDRNTFMPPESSTAFTALIFTKLTITQYGSVGISCPDFHLNRLIWNFTLHREPSLP
jgi:hypothetical protein